MDDLKAFKDSQYNWAQGNYFLTNDIVAGIFMRQAERLFGLKRVCRNFHNNLL
jgi:hypothetical protein